MESELAAPAYNLLDNTAPWDDSQPVCGHWRIQVTPRTTGIAGFEIATAWHINTMPPEEAAARLRDRMSGGAEPMIDFARNTDAGTPQNYRSPVSSDAHST